MCCRYSFVECGIVTRVSEQNEDIPTNTSSKSRRTFTNFKKRCALSAMMSTSLKIIHVIWVVLYRPK